MIESPIYQDLHNDRTFGQVYIGRGTYTGYVKFRTYSSNEKIFVGRYCSIASDVIISAGGNHRPELPSTWPFDNFLHGLPNPTRTYREAERPTTIGHDVWIGDQAIIGGGVQVGSGAVVGAGAVVFRDVPPYAIVVGNPAKVIRMRFSEKQIAALLGACWWNWSPEHIRERHEWFYLPINEFIGKFCSI